MTQEFVHRMGVNASTGNAGDPANLAGTVTLTDSMPVYRDSVGGIAR